ncbi:hypothetical protein [Janthinobacterium lividum]|uniref:hypothetical protein n=1 Tax=Janthinobacterium lividum TaxID=29581 RepID=UPI00140C3464|nr:hypothetical protein [Janthinobacterium lividum]NHQ93291.1 hypothetical protein [Janthinobacterium lividum]
MKRRMARQIIPKIILAALLAGCASAPPAPQLVEVPVFTPCVKMQPQRPVYEIDGLTPVATDGETILALARDWARGRKYEADLESILMGCLSLRY